MQHQVLVVDRAYSPIKIVEWEDAITDIMSDRFSVLEYSNKVVHSAHDEWYLPDIIVAPRNMKISKRVKFDYDAIKFRDNHVCAYCGNKYTMKHLTVDHIYPRVRGGGNSWANCITACRPCNNRKAGHTPEEAGMPLLYKPLIPRNNIEVSLFTMNMKPEWLPYMPSTVIEYIKVLKERTQL